MTSRSFFKTTPASCANSHDFHRRQTAILLARCRLCPLPSQLSLRTHRSLTRGMCPSRRPRDRRYWFRTGFLSELFLKNGNRVYGIEPNKDMRQAGEDYLASYDAFSSIDGSAEATTLDDASVDFITAGQSFHWFEP